MIKDRLQIARGSAARITSFLNSFRDYEIIFNTDTNSLGIVLPDKTIVYTGAGALDINEHNTSETSHNDIRQKVDEARAIAEGKSRARVFATKSALDTWLLDDENIASLQIGDNFYIEETDKPDYWWNGTTIKELETQKVDLTEYAKTTDLPTKVSQLENDSEFLTEDDLPASMPPTEHSHDDRYYTESEVDTKLSEKADVEHTHTKDEITDFPTSMPPTEHTHDDRYYTETEVDTKLDSKADAEHAHDDRYYTESEVDTKLSEKADTEHTHTKSEITDFPTIPTIPDITVTNGSAEIGKYISQVVVDATDKHKLIVTKADLPQGFSGKFSDLTEVPDEFTPSEHNHDDRYYTETEVDTKLDSKADVEHTHDDRYYTETEVDTKLSGKANTTHQHTKSEIIDFPTIPTIPDITVNNGHAESGKYISQVVVDATDKHKLIVTKADLPQGFSGDYNDLTNKPTIPTLSHNISTDIADTTKAVTPNAVGNYTYSRSAIDAMIGDIETLLAGI